MRTVLLIDESGFLFDFPKPVVILNKLMENPLIRNAIERDAEAIARIYNPYILKSIITFEEAIVTAEEIAKRMAEVTGANLPYLLAEINGEVIGYAYASKWKPRSAYRFAVESTIYLESDYAGMGLGTNLYQALLGQLRERGIHTVIGGVALPNPASIRLHEKLGFTKVAEFREVGFKFSKWINVGYWELKL
jgi:L-amino acid N-acyltransferase YncA